MLQQHTYTDTHTRTRCYICLALVCRRLLSIDESRPFAHCLNLRCDLPVLWDFCCCCAFRSYWFCINCDACVSAFAFYWFANKYSTFKILILKHVLSVCVRWLAVCDFLAVSFRFTYVYEFYCTFNISFKLNFL